MAALPHLCAYADLFAGTNLLIAAMPVSTVLLFKCRPWCGRPS